VQTNIVNCDVRGQALDAQALARKLAGQGVLVNWKRDKLRFVTHAQVDEAAVRLAIRAVGASL
jgi:threonine aldolase